MYTVYNSQNIPVYTTMNEQEADYYAYIEGGYYVRN